MKRIMISAAAIVLAGAIAIVAYQHYADPGSATPSVPMADKMAQLAQGRYLASAGNCMGCHTTAGGAPFAGGRAIHTPFGAIYASNITPDLGTGIGSWSSDDFWRALHNGKSKDGSFLYPAFPYTNYTKVTRADADALYAYLRSVPAVRQQNRPNALAFPYNQRLLLAFWRALYFRPGSFEPRPAQSAAWNRGAYLVQGLGHCSACHTPRDALGGSVAGRQLAGAMMPMQGWYASALNGHPATGLGEVSAADLAILLHTGVSPRGAVYGPMAEVVAGSLQHLSGEDVGGMVAYLKSLPSQEEERGSVAVLSAGGEQQVLARGAALYASQCAACHMEDGSGAGPAYPPLAGSRALSHHVPANAVNLVLNGGFPPSTVGNPRPYSMPPFGFKLDDDEVAAVVSYTRHRWGGRKEMLSPVYVARQRGAGPE